MHVVIKTGHKTTDAWLANQAIWNDKDMWLAFIGGVLFGLFLGAIFI